MTADRFYLSRICFSLVLFFFAQLSLAGIGTAADFQVTPFAGYTFGGSFDDSSGEGSYDLAEGGSYGVLLNLKDKSKRGAFYELLYSHQESDLEGEGPFFADDSTLDVDIDYLHIGGTYGSEGERVNPYVAAGIGLTHMSPERGDSETRFSFSIGAGLKVPVTEHLGLRIEGRGFGTVFDGSGSIFCRNNDCAVRANGDMVWQFTSFAGLSISF